METPPSNETLAALTKLLRDATSNLNPQPPAPFGFPPPQPAFAPSPTFGPPSVQPTGILIPIRVETQAGEIGCYVALPASAIQSLPAAIAQLQAQGYPIRVYQSRDSGNAGNFGSGSGSGGWQGQGQRRWGRRW